MGFFPGKKSKMAITTGHCIAYVLIGNCIKIISETAKIIDPQTVHKWSLGHKQIIGIIKIRKNYVVVCILLILKTSR